MNIVFIPFKIKSRNTMKMFLQKVLFLVASLISKVFGLSSGWHTYTNEKGETVEDGDMLSLYGPRIAVMPVNGSFRLTGIFAIGFLRTKEGKLISCIPFIFTIKKGDKVYFGKAAQQKCRELHPPLPRDHVPMFQDDSGCSFG